MTRKGTSTIPRANKPVKLPHSTYLLTLCQALNLTAAVVSVTVAALVGAMLAPSAVWATVPYGCQFAAVALATYPASSFMRRYGRRKGFIVGAMCLIAAGCVGYDAISASSFFRLIAAHTLLGIYVAFANFYRFAAVDALDPAIRGRGVSLVVAGGIVAAVTGPFISINLKEVDGFLDYSLCYAAFVVLGIATILLIAIWRPNPSSCTSAASRRTTSVTMQGSIAAAMIASALSYFVMNMLMVQASLMMASNHIPFETASMAIQGHVIAMFAPSFITGVVLARAGHRNTLFLGYLLLAASAALSVWSASMSAMVIALILLGTGWNFGYVGAAALLAYSLADEKRHRVQGISDTITALFATAGAFLPALFQFWIGWRNTNVVCFGLCIAAICTTAICMRERAFSTRLRAPAD